MHQCIDNGGKLRTLRVRKQGQCRHSVTSPKGGFVRDANVVHGNPFGGHTLGPIIPQMENHTDLEAGPGIHSDKE